jgi:hypothetical protein
MHSQGAGQEMATVFGVMTEKLGDCPPPPANSSIADTLTVIPTHRMNRSISPFMHPILNCPHPPFSMGETDKSRIIRICRSILLSNQRNTSHISRILQVHEKRIGHPDLPHRPMRKKN